MNEPLGRGKVEWTDTIGVASASAPAGLTVDFEPRDTLPSGSINLSDPTFYFTIYVRNKHKQPITALTSDDSSGFHSVELEVEAINGKKLEIPISVNRHTSDGRRDYKTTTFQLQPGQQIERKLFWGDASKRLFSDKYENYSIDGGNLIKPGSKITLNARFMQSATYGMTIWTGKLNSPSRTYTVAK